MQTVPRAFAAQKPIILPPGPAPVADAERIELIDALRGFALAGVLLVNTGSMTLFGYLSPGQRAALPTAGFDAVARPMIAFLASGKFITLFSLLFGLGFAVQLMRAEERGGDVVRLYARRLLVLLAIGLVHATLLWWGDVLRFYAVVGFALLLVRRAPARVLVGAGLAIACLVAPAIAAFVQPALEPGLRGMAAWGASDATALAAFSGSDYGAVVRTNPRYDWKYFIAYWWEPLVILSRFLLGYWAGRALLFHRPDVHRPLLVRLLTAGLVVGVAGSAVAAWRDAGALLVRVPALRAPLGQFALEVAASTGTLALGVAYATGFALLFLRTGWRRRLEALAPIGRMALTSYLTHSVLAVGLFYGIGLGIGPRFGVPGRLAFWALVFGLQVPLSRWWLARFRFGPVEWLWRSLTYGRRQPMRVTLPTMTTEERAIR